MAEGEDVWDGTTVNTDWYDINYTNYSIRTAEELAGLAQNINGTAGEIPRYDFAGKTYSSPKIVSVSDNDAIARVTVNGRTVTLDENNQFTLFAAEGMQRIVATDEAGNRTEVTVTVNGDTIGPDAGDYRVMWTWLLLLFASGTGIAVTLYLINRRKAE